MKITLNPDNNIVNTVRDGLRRTGGFCFCCREKKEDIGASAMKSKRRLKARPLRATVIAYYIINPTKDEAYVKPELEFTVSPALPSVPSDTAHPVL